VTVEVVLAPPEGGGANLLLRVVDPFGRPVPGAAVSLDGSDLGRTSSGGDLRLEDLDPGRRRLEVRAAPYGSRVLPALALKVGDQNIDVPLDWASGAVQIVTRSADGPVTDAMVRFAGPQVLAPTPVDASGERLFSLPPGSWQVLVVSPRYGLAQQDVTVREDQVGLRTLEFDLEPMGEGEAELLVRVQDPDGRPVPGAEVRLDGVAKGKASAGGALLLASLPTGEVDLEVMAPTFRPRQVRGVEVAPGSRERIVTLDWVPARVEVTVEREDGTPLDAEVRFDGPQPMPSQRTGLDGRHDFELRPGTWQVLASTSDLGVGRQEIQIAPGQDVAAVRLALTPARVVIREQVHFEFASAVLSPDSSGVLDEVANTLLAHTEIARAEVQGHTDNVGGPAYNLALSEERARSVLRALVARGVAPERLWAQGYGATRPIAENESEVDRAQNRRVQFEITEVVTAEAP
jgi:outer membrane protein OmpA-like peptidoglycan-associated protein